MAINFTGSGPGGAIQIPPDEWSPAQGEKVRQDLVSLDEDRIDHETRIADLEDVAASDGSPRFTEVFIASGEVIALSATPKVLLSAPGASRVIEFLGGVIFIASGSIPYVESGSNLAIRYVGSGGIQISEDIEATGFIDQSDDVMTMVRPKHGTVATQAQCENQPIVLHNLGVEYTAGDRHLRCKFGYRIWTTAW